MGPSAHRARPGCVEAGDDTTDGCPGQLLILPGVRHRLTALEDAVVLLTVAKRPSPIASDTLHTDLGTSYQRRRGRGRWPVNAALPEPRMT